MSDAGGRQFKRGEGTTVPGPPHTLLSQPLVKINGAAVEAWLRRESSHRPARAALAFRLLRAFLDWCGEHPVYRNIAQPEAHAPKRVRGWCARRSARWGAFSASSCDSGSRRYAPSTTRSCLRTCRHC